MDSSYSDDYAWLDTENEHDIADEFMHRALDALQDKCEDTGTWEQVFYKDIWEFVTACFTEKACQDYIDENRHHFDEARIYVASAYRNDEFIAVREMLLRFGQPDEQ